MKNSTINRIFNVIRKMSNNTGKKHDPRKARRYARAIVATADDKNGGCYLQAKSALRSSKSLVRFMKAIGVCPFVARGLATAQHACKQDGASVFTKIRNVKFSLRYVSRKSAAGLTLQGELAYYQFFAKSDQT